MYGDNTSTPKDEDTVTHTIIFVLELMQDATKHLSSTYIFLGNFLPTYSSSAY